MSEELKNAKKTELRILESAEMEFVEKGYDGARVDEIAKRAQLNKAQLYYYFRSKENILNELMKRNIREVEEIVEKNFDISSVSSKESFEAFIDKVFAFFKEKENIIRIIMLEALKSGSNNLSIFEIFEPLYNKIKTSVQDMGLQYEEVAVPIDYFFMDLAPFLFFTVFKNKFSNFYKIPQETLEMQFDKNYKAAQLKYFKNLYSKRNNKIQNK